MKLFRFLSFILIAALMLASFSVFVMAQEDGAAAQDPPWVRTALYISLTAMLIVLLIVILAKLEHIRMKRKIRQLEEEEKKKQSKGKSDK